MVTPREAGLCAAQDEAEKVLRRFGVRTAAHIRIEAFASVMGLTVVDGPLDGARARLSTGRRPVIRVSERTPSAAARRFSIAHELGHYVLRHVIQKPQIFCATPVGAKAPRDPHKRDHESESNVFSAGVLMPRRLIAPRCDTSKPSLEIAQTIVAEFGTSLPASAIRFVELTPERCAAVLSERGVITWAVRSPTFTAKLQRGKRLDRGTVAFDYFSTRKIDDRPQPIAAEAWLDTDADVDLIEHSVPVPEGGVITLLWIPERVAAPLGMSND